jgi:TonB family protein
MIWFAAAFMTSFFTPTGTANQPVSGVDAENAYPATADGLKALLAELMAPRAEDVPKSESLYATLTIPDHKQWFEKTFGSEEGARLEAKYSASLQEFSARPKFVLQNAARQGKTVVNVRLYPTPDEPPLVQAFLAAMTAPTTLYHATGAVGPDDKRVMLLGNFVYVDGGFRYVDFKLMEGLSTAPAIRVRIGGNVQAPKLLNRVNPEYPVQAKVAGIQGTVKLHVILAKDGSVRQLDVVSGDPQLVESAIKAVKQWKYEPTLLNGQAIEVDTVVDVVFQLRN